MTNEIAQNQNPDLYQSNYVRQLFDDMAATYGAMNLISSFGFTVRWRRQCVNKISLAPGQIVFDLMSGMGEMWPSIFEKTRRKGNLYGVDFSREMCKRSMQQNNSAGVEVIETDVLSNQIASASADVIVSGFGLKTFSEEQKQLLAKEIARILRPGGCFSLLEISVPPNWFLRAPFMFYLKCLIPIIGRLFLGNPDNYRLLWVYTSRFGNAMSMCKFLEECGLQVKYERYFFGCATGVSGSKP